jgi:hypothetical protein
MVEQVNEHGGDVYDLLVHGDAGRREDAPAPRRRDGRARTSTCACPQGGPEHYQDIYVLAGFPPQSRYGYVFGWCTWEELMAQPIRTDIKYPARCIPLIELHPMQDLERYCLTRAIARA